MASSPTDAAPRTPSPIAFALHELTACWNQGYEALLRGDLDRVGALMCVADGHVPNAGDGLNDTPEEEAARRMAAAARGRLEHGMRVGLDGLVAELASSRRGARALRAYGDPTLHLGSNLRLHM